MDETTPPSDPAADPAVASSDPASSDPASSDPASSDPASSDTAGDPVAPAVPVADDVPPPDASDDSPPPAPSEPDGVPTPPERQVSVEEEVLATLRAGPATTREIARRIAQPRDGLLEAREGHLLPLLLELRRRGRTDASWTDLPEGRRLVHRLAGTGPPAPVTPPQDAAAPLPSRSPPGVSIRHAAERSTDALSFAPRLAEELRAEALHHLEDATADHEAEGAPRQDAETRALAAWGDPWRISAELRRAARGTRATPFPNGPWQGLRAIVVNDAPILAIILASIAFLRIGVIGAYHIPTKSMEPTLHGDRSRGDRILVLKGGSAPSRFDIWVFDGWAADRKHFVKRMVGLPGEDLALRGGDLFVDGTLVRKEGASYEALLFPLFDLEGEARRARRRGAVPLTDRMQDLWTAKGGAGWTVASDGTFEGRVSRAAPDSAVLEWKERLTDAVLDTDTLDLIETGYVDVSDLRVEADVTFEDATARAAVRLTRDRARFVAVLRGDEPGVSISVDGETVARREETSLQIGRPSRVRFAHVDHVLRLEIDGELVLRHDLPAPEATGRDSKCEGGVEFVLDAGSARIRPLRLERDVYWTSDYEAVGRSRLGPDEYFMLGDNSSNSDDSRSRGPVHGDRLVGRPFFIVWPLSRMGMPR